MIIDDGQSLYIYFPNYKPYLVLLKSPKDYVIQEVVECHMMWKGMNEIKVTGMSETLKGNDLKVWKSSYKGNVFKFSCYSYNCHLCLTHTMGKEYKQRDG